MVQLETRTLESALDHWRDATREALQAGASEKDLQAMLKTEVADSQEHHCETCPPDNYDPDTVYAELPEGLITVPEAARKYNVNRRTIQTWLNQNRLERKGRMKGSARGGGFVLVDEGELVRYMNAPRSRGGRPRKSEEALQTGAAEEYPHSMLRTEAAAQQLHGLTCRHEDYDPDTVYAELPAGLIDLPTAATRYKVNVRTIYNWLRRGRLALCGRLRAPATGGGYLVVCEDELVAFMRGPRDRGGRPQQT